MIYKTIATFFGAGYFPVAPGTAGAVLASLISICFLLSGMQAVTFSIVHLILIIVFYILGVISCKKTEREWGSDPSRVVVDEAIGYWITVLFIDPKFIYLIIGLLLFRFFDIVKPLGIRLIDQKMKNAHGVMLDDVLSGIYACLCLHFMIEMLNLWQK